MKTLSPGFIAVILAVILGTLITFAVVPDIEHGKSPGAVPYSHVYLIALAIVIAGGLVADSIQRR